jgi:hypothetical protein
MRMISVHFPDGRIEMLPIYSASNSGDIVCALRKNGKLRLSDCQIDTEYFCRYNASYMRISDAITGSTLMILSWQLNQSFDD